MIPVIDVAPLWGADEDAYSRVSNEIDKACREVGFFYIKNHSISAEELDKVNALARQFFAEPVEEKLKIDLTKSNGQHRGYGGVAAEQLDPSMPNDFKETFDMGLDLPADHPEVLAKKPLRGTNRHPDIPGWRDEYELHYRNMLDLGKTLLKAMSSHLGVSKEFFDDCFTMPISVLRVLHYPPQDKEGISAGAHTDYGCLTLLLQDSIGGLQVRDMNGNWVDAVPMDGTFVVNIGDMMSRWTNGAYKSTLHRVKVTPNTDRYSMPFFLEPNPDTELKCMPACHDVQNPPKYPVITASEHLLKRFAATYAYRR